MIAKKNSRFDLEQKRTVLFQVGLFAAGSFTLAAFTYTSGVPVLNDQHASTTQPIEWVIEQPEQPETPKPMVQQPQRQETEDQPQQTESLDNSQDLSENMESTENTSTDVKSTVDPPKIGGFSGGFVEIDEDPIDPFPSTPAAYIGGLEEMQKEIHENFNYPEIEQSFGTQGTVYLSFVIERDGTVSNIKVERGVSEDIDREAKRVVKLLNHWKPAENAHGKVRTIAYLPIRVTLE